MKKIWILAKYYIALWFIFIHYKTINMTKELFIENAKKSNVSVTYSGKEKTMFVSGDEKRVKSFIRSRNLMGKAAHSFAIKQSKI